MLKTYNFLDKFGDPIKVHMLLEGGDWYSGLSIMDAIYSAKSKVSIIAYGSASSMSGVILQAADERILMPNTYFMIHSGSISIDGSTTQAALSAIRYEEMERKKMVKIFADRAISSNFFKRQK